MKRFLLIIGLLSAMCGVYAQQEGADVRTGNKLYEDGKFTEAEVEYRKGLQKKPTSFEANFNLGNALFRQEKYEEAMKYYGNAAAQTPDDKAKLAAAYHNIGNSLLMGNQIEQSIEAYKQALKNNPADDETRYNLAFAQQMLKQQQQQQQQQNQKDDPILAQAKDLVRQRKYQAAYDLLKKNENKNPGTYGEFMERISNVIKMM